MMKKESYGGGGCTRVRQCAPSLCYNCRTHKMNLLRGVGKITLRGKRIDKAAMC